MAEVKWIKVSTSMFDSNRKIKQIEVMPEGDSILVIWLKLLLLAGNINDGGAIYITPEIPYTDELLANELRKPIATVRLALNTFVKFGMIEIVDDILMLTSWQKYQSTDRLEELKQKDRDRKRLKRAQEKQAKIAESVDSPWTVLGCPLLEEDIEEDKEKDIHSIYLSGEEKQQKNLLGTLGEGVVVMSDEQFEDLCKRLSRHEIEHYFGVVVECEKSGKHFKKPHYQAILEMAEKDRKLI